MRVGLGGFIFWPLPHGGKAIVLSHYRSPSAATRFGTPVPRVVAARYSRHIKIAQLTDAIPTFELPGHRIV
jgi:hypothetical protein